MKKKSKSNNKKSPASHPLQPEPNTPRTSKYDLTKWNPISLPGWGVASAWESYYQEETALMNKDAKKTSSLFEEYDMLVNLLSDLKNWEIKTIFDVGCGLCLMPYVLEYWGYQVTAIDLSKSAIQFLEKFNPTEEQLARCIRYYKPNPVFINRLGQEQHTHTVLNDLALTLPLLQKKRSLGGSLTFIVGDWNDQNLLNHKYDLIHGFNIFNKASQAFTLKSIQTFKNLLKPGGILLLDNEILFSADVAYRIIELIKAEGFSFMIDFNIEKDHSKKYVYLGWSPGYYPEN